MLAENHESRAMRKRFRAGAAALRLVLGVVVALAASSVRAHEQSAGTRAIVLPPAPSAVEASAAAKGLVWDALKKTYEAKPGEKEVVFEFNATNPTTATIAIQSIHTSCGCTVAQLPPLPAAPYLLAARASAPVRVTLNLQGKAGVIAKTITVTTAAGPYTLTVEAVAPGAALASIGADRERNIAIAARDRQAIFKGDCAKCHAEPAGGKTGQDLYRAVCTICHEAHPRASMIPDLQVAREGRDLAYWTKWVTEGGSTMMPAFAERHGGPLNAEQVGTLAIYLFAEFSRTPFADSARAKTNQ